MMSSGTIVFFIQKGYSPTSGKTNSIPVPSGTRSRYMSPCERVGSSVATSARTTSPSGSVIRGPLYESGVLVVFVGIGLLHVSRIARTRRALLLTFPLGGSFLFLVFRHQVVLLRVIAERSERHPEQLRGLSLYAARSLECFEHEDLPDRLEVI